MIKFEKYPHVNELISFYIKESGNSDMPAIIQSGINNEDDARVFCKFIWDMVDKIHEDEELGRIVIGSADNTDIIPDLSYEITNYMRRSGFFSVWEASADSSD